MLRPGDSLTVWQQDGSGGGLTGPLDVTLEFARESDARAAIATLDGFDAASDSGCQLYSPAPAPGFHWDAPKSGIRLEVEGGRYHAVKAHP